MARLVQGNLLIRPHYKDEMPGVLRMRELKKLIPEKTVFRILLLCLLVLLLYYPAIFAEISIVDDLDMVSTLLNSDGMSLGSIFIPRLSGGGYYRPLLGLSQYFDKELWMMSSQVMHFENILFHLFNAVLVYLITMRLSSRVSLQRVGLAPLVASLVFALHPIATESVNWISGRTDSMACNFILISALFIFRYQDDGKRMNLLLSCAALMLALLTKEVAFGFILAIPFLLTPSRRDPSQIPDPPVAPSGCNGVHPFIVFLLCYAVSAVTVLYGGAYWFVLVTGICYLFSCLWRDIAEKPVIVVVREHLAATGMLSVVLLATFTMFFVFRKIAFTSNIDRISNTLKLIFQDTDYAISIFLGAAGFYVKKFLAPLPLNFFILEINPLYDLLGIAVFLVTLRLISRRDTIASLSLAGMCCVLPAFPFAFGTIAWTGYAERYIYVASGFWSIAISLFAARFLGELDMRSGLRTLAHAGVGALLVMMAVVTYRRNICWQSNMTLLSDTVAQNPRQKELRGLYMLAFIRSGDLKTAREQYRIATSLHSNKYLENIDLNMAGIEANEGHKTEAEALLIKVMSDSRGNSVSALKFYTKFLENELILAKESDSKAAIQKKIIPLYKQMYGLTHDPFILYRLGQIHITRNENGEAVHCFERASHEYPSGSTYAVNSTKIAEKLKKKIGPTSP